MKGALLETFVANASSASMAPPPAVELPYPLCYLHETIMHRLRLTTCLLVLLLATSTCSKPLGKKSCTSMADCPAGQVCRDQLCRAPRTSLSGATTASGASARPVVIALTAADATALACAMGDKVAGLSCAFSQEDRRVRAAAAAQTDATVLQPITTTPDNENLLVAGLWTQSAVRQHLAKPAPTDRRRFHAHCSFEQQGSASKASAQWGADGAWSRADGWPIGTVTNCQVR